MTHTFDIPDATNGKTPKRPAKWGAVKNAIRDQNLLVPILNRFGHGHIQPKREFPCPKCGEWKARLSNADGLGGCNRCGLTWSGIIDFLSLSSGQDANELCRQIAESFSIDGHSVGSGGGAPRALSPVSTSAKRKTKPTRKPADGYCVHRGWVIPQGDRIPPKIAHIFANDQQGFSLEAVQALGARYVQWKHPHNDIPSQTAIGIPIWGRSDLSPCNWALRPPMPGARLFGRDNDRTVGIPKATAYSIPTGVQNDRCGVLTTIAARELIRTGQAVGGIRVLKTEGESDLLAAITRLPEDEYLCWTNSDGARSTNVGEWFLPMLSKIAPVEWIVCHDADEAGQDGARRWCNAISRLIPGATVKNVVLPYPIEAKKGKDLRDFFRDGFTFSDFERLVDETPRWTGESEQEEAPEVENMEQGNVENDPDGLAGGEGSRPLVMSIANACDRTDNANAVRFVESFGRLIRYVPTWKRWLCWDGRRWKVDDDSSAVTGLARRYATSLWLELSRLANDLGDDLGTVASFVRATNQTRGVEGILRLARSEQAICIHHETLNSHPTLLNVRNGTIDLDTGVLQAHNPEDHLTQLAGVEFDPDARCDEWLSTLDLVFDGDQELVRYCQQLLGYSCSGLVGEAILPVAYGSGANGKSTIWNTVVEILGDYALVAPSHLLVGTTQEHACELVALYQRRFVTVNEPEQNARLREARVKELTGDATITARGMKENYWSFDRTHKFWMATNHLPRIDGQDEGIWRRVKLIPFTVDLRKRVKPRPDFHRHLVEHEGAGILNWLLQGFQDYQKNGFIEPEAVKAATKSYRTTSDVLSEFIADCCEVDPSHVVESSALYSAYREWSGAKEMTQKAFSTEMERRFQKSKRSFGSLRNKNVFEGVRVKDSE